MAHNWKRFLLPLLILLILLTVLVTLLLTALDPKEDADPTSAPTETAPALIAPDTAAANLSEARSFRLKVSMINNADTYSYENTYTFQLTKDPDGIQTILYSQSDTLVSDGQSIESAGDQAYYHGNTAYIHYVHGYYPTAAAMRISDEPFVLAAIVEEQSGLLTQSSGNATVAAFAALDPVSILQEDGSVSYQLQSMTKEQFSAIYSPFAGADATQEMIGSMGNNCSFNVWADVDPQGYLTQFKLEILNVYSSESSQNITILFAIDQINAIDSIEMPEYVKDFSLEDSAEIVYTHDGVNAHYYYSTAASADSDNADTPGLIFGGFGDAYVDDYTVESYEVLSQIDGVPVTEVQGILNNTFSSVTVARLVIPTGVKVNIRGVYTENAFESYTENTILFFNDKEEDVEKTFLVEGEATDSKEAVFFKAAYYAGQWEFVDGVPTPKG